MKNLKRGLFAATGIAALNSGLAFAQQDAEIQLASVDADEVVVIAEAKSYNNSVVTEGMFEQQTPLTSPLALIDNLPGVSIQEGDTFGFDDWSTTISIRGFQTSLGDQQIGITIDGMPNGNSNYGGGAKANRYIDTMNIGGIEVSQGTADIASRSNEALGGTLNFLSGSPLDERRGRVSVSLGQFDAERYYGRFDTGLFFNDTTKAWVSISHQSATDWVNASAENRRDHIAAKFESDFDTMALTGYFSYDDTHEDNYQRLFSAADFESNPEWDRLTDEWTGLPGIDQLYRQSWSTLRENVFAYLKGDIQLTQDFNLSGGVYLHKNYGRGDWVPGYIVNLVDDGPGAPQSELSLTSPILGGSPLGGSFQSDTGNFRYVDGSGIVTTPTCTDTTRVFWAAQIVPSCYPDGSQPVMSYRHTHYRKSRLGFVADADWTKDFGSFINTLRGGVWYEDTTRDESRDWHRLTNAAVNSEFEETPYWVQYDRSYPQDTFKWYVEDVLEFGPITANFGIKQFLANVEREDNFVSGNDVAIESDSDILLSGGLQYDTPMEGLSIFAGYAENFKALSDLLLERPATALDQIQPETARNIDAGLRFSNSRVSATVTYYDIKFENRLIFVDNQAASGPNFLIGTDGTYFNAGGIDSSGVEFAGSFFLSDELTFYTAYTYNDSTYLGTGDAAIDAETGLVPGNTVVNSPKNQFVASLDWNSGPYRAGVSTKFTDSRFVYPDNSWEVDGYWLTDLYFGVRGEAISDTLQGVDASIVVNNVTDESYLGGITGGAWIGAPRTVVFTLTADF